MEISSVIKLIKGGVEGSVPQQTWIDLGAGSGTFTNALAGLLDRNSIVYAVDKERRVLEQIKPSLSEAKIVTVQQDFTREDFSHPQANGILMANALHFVKDQSTFLRRLKDKSLMQDGRIIVVEYEQSKPNQWVPFPVSFDQLMIIGNEVGFHSIRRMAAIPSVYQRGLMYSALLRMG